MRFSIVTPSFRSSSWLKLCIASVADQEVPLEHIVQDARSDDGTLDWLLGDSRVTACVEEDSGMYDAVNRGWARAKGRILAHLNCDEQYLPGALKKVSRFFQDHPDTEIVFADVIALGNNGEFLCYRKVQLPSVAYTRAACTLSTLTCATFLRRSVLEKHDLWFDPRYRVIGDAYWVIRSVEKKIPMAVLREYTSAFTLTGVNMNLSQSAEREPQTCQHAEPVPLRTGTR